MAENRNRQMSSKATVDSYKARASFRASLVPPPLRLSSRSRHEAPTYQDDDARPAAELPARPERSLWRRSLNAYPFASSEPPYSIGMLHTAHNSELDDESGGWFGLRRMSIARPVVQQEVAKHASYTASICSSSSLPSHKQDIVDHTELDPLNGRTAWLHSLTGMLVVFNCWGLGNAYGLFQAYYTTIYLLNTNPSHIAWIGSTQLALVFALGVPVGRLVDKGYFRVVFHGGTVLMIAGLMLSSVCTHLWSLWLVNGLVTGLGMGMCFCSGIVALMTWFDERKIGSAMALGAAGSCIGGIVYVLLARYLLKVRGYKSTVLILGAMAAATMIPPNLVFRIRGQSHPVRASKNAAQPNRSRINWKQFTTPAYLLAASGMFFSFLGVYFGFVYIPSFAYTVLHMSETASTNLLIFMLAANLPGRFLPALISDRCIGPLNTLIPSIFLSSAVIWLWAASEEHKGSLIVIACFYGFVSAGVQVLYAPTVYSFCLEPVSSEEANEGGRQLAMDRVGVKAGGIFTCIGLACFIGLPIGGALIEYRTSRGMAQPYLGAQVFAGASLLLGGCLLIGSRVAKSGWAARRT